MRVPPIARNALFVLGMGLLTANYVHAAAAVLTPAAGQAITTANGASVASGVVRGGYVIGQAALYIAEFGGAVTMQVGARIAAGAVVAAAGVAAVGPLVVGGLALGAAAAAAKDWLDDAHAAGRAQDYEYDPNTDTIVRKPLGGQTVDENLTKDQAGNTIASNRSADWIQQACAAGCTTGYDSTAYSCGAPYQSFWIRNSVGNVVTTFCIGSEGVVLGAGTGTKPTADQWQQLANDLAATPVSPKLLENMGKPIPVDPVPVINPPDQTGAQDVVIGESNPAPNLQSRPQTVTGQAVPISNTNPVQYTQPTWTITPSNSAANPYGVTVTSTSTNTSNPATPTNPSTPIPGTATPATPDVCQQNPTAAMCQPVGTFTDPSMPPIPELYVRKYPQGLVGIWQDKTAALTQTSLVTVLGQMMPTGITGGTCPTWTLNLSFGPDWADMGTHEVAPPCWLWDVAKAIMIISALMLARQLIFGG